jgi:hypothetical protein
MHQTAFGLMEGCIGKLYHKRMLQFAESFYANETLETLVTSFLSVDSIELKTDRMSNKPLDIESALR